MVLGRHQAEKVDTFVLKNGLAVNVDLLSTLL